MRKIFLVCFFIIPIVCFSQRYNGIILRVIDGDTFVFQGEEGSLKIRLNGIDAPELDQLYGNESKEFLNQFAGDSCVIETFNMDKYGRTIANLYVNNENINLLLVSNGLVWHYKKYSADQKLADAENKAREEKKGLWKDSQPIAPWDWRQIKN